MGEESNIRERRMTVAGVDRSPRFVFNLFSYRNYEVDYIILRCYSHRKLFIVVNTTWALEGSVAGARIVQATCP